MTEYLMFWLAQAIVGVGVSVVLLGVLVGAAALTVEVKAWRRRRS
jgi:hypothetical protein